MRSLAALLLVTCCSTPIAQAQSDGRERAVVLAREANDLYQRGSYGQAAVLLERAYALYPTPSLLFNTGRAYEANGELARAIDAYQRFLGAGEVSDLERRDVEERLAGIEQRMDDEASDPVNSVDPDPELGLRGGQTPAAPRELPYGAFVVAGLGVAMVAVAIGFGASALSLRDAAQTEPVAIAAADLINTAQTFATVANVFFVLGGLVSIGGVIWAVVDLSSEPEGQTSLRLGPGGVALRRTF